MATISWNSLVPSSLFGFPTREGEEKRAWYTLTVHVQDLHPLAQDPWATGCTGSALGLYVPKAKISQEL